MFKFQIPPDSQGYTVVDGDEVLSVKLDGGASRYRRDVLNSNSLVNCQWSLDRNEYNYARAFFKFATANGSQPFLIDLVLDEAMALTEHTAWFVPGTMQLRQQQGHLYVISAQMEVAPIPRNAALDESLVTMWTFYQPDPTAFMNRLEKLVNFDLPKAWKP
jgi:hypothetical protein